MQLHSRIEEIAARGVRLALIGTGTPEQAAEFERLFAPGIDVLVDPEMVGYRAAKLKRGLFHAYKPSSLLAFLRALRDGFRPGPTQGDALQLGGVFVISPEPRTLLAHISRAIHDRKPLDRILEAVDSDGAL